MSLFSQVLQTIISYYSEDVLRSASQLLTELRWKGVIKKKIYMWETMLMRQCSFIGPIPLQPINLRQSIQWLTCSHLGTERQYRDLHQCHILCRWWWASQTCRQSTHRGHVGGTEQSLGLSRCWPGLQSGARQDFCCHSAHLGHKCKVRFINDKIPVLKVYQKW